MAKLYVGTYAKYNEGSIDGAWLDLEDYDSPENFLEACYKLHSDEEDPELMFQDYEDFPKEYYSESCPDLEAIYKWLDMSSEEQNILKAYQNCVDPKGTFEKAQEHFMGVYPSWIDFVHERAREEIDYYCGGDKTAFNFFSDYFDYDFYATSIRTDYDYTRLEDKVYIFNN